MPCSTRRPPARRIVEVELLNPFNPKEFDADKPSIVDVKAKDCGGRTFIVKMQMMAFRDLPKQYLHYWASNYRQQIGEGQGYSLLRPVILIAIACDPLFADAVPYHLRFRRQDAKHNAVFSDDKELHTIELSKLRKASEELLSELDMWSYFLEHAGELDADAIPPSLATAEIRQAIRQMIVISQTKEERDLYEARLMRQRDEQARSEDPLRRGSWRDARRSCGARFACWNVR